MYAYAHIHVDLDVCVCPYTPTCRHTHICTYTRAYTQNTQAWDLAGALKHPLYESVFVRNVLTRASSLTYLNLSNNDLRGRAAIALSRGISASSSLRILETEGCRWDDGMRTFANAVREKPSLERLDQLTLKVRCGGVYIHTFKVAHSHASG